MSRLGKLKIFLLVTLLFTKESLITNTTLDFWFIKDYCALKFFENADKINLEKAHQQLSKIPNQKNAGHLQLCKENLIKPQYHAF